MPARIEVGGGRVTRDPNLERAAGLHCTLQLRIGRRGLE